VEVRTRSLHVSCARTGESFLEGELERAVVPDESVWAAGDGEGEAGFVLYLKKANLELLARPWEHAESWWPRLFTYHAPIAWDDYEKDYSDLPAQLKKDYARLEAKDSARAALEHSEKVERDGFTERDEARKRARQERLNQLRGGEYKPWVQLDRENPKYDEMEAAPGPGDRDTGLFTPSE